MTAVRSTRSPLADRAMSALLWWVPAPAVSPAGGGFFLLAKLHTLKKGR